MHPPRVRLQSLAYYCTYSFFIHRSVDMTQPKQLSGFTFNLFAPLHSLYASSCSQLPGRLLCQSALIFGRQDLSGYCCTCLYNKVTYLPFQLSQHTLVILGRGFMRLGKDLFSSSSGLLGLLLSKASGAIAGVTDELCSLGIGLRHSFFFLALDTRQLGFYLLGVFLPLSDELAAFFK